MRKSKSIAIAVFLGAGGIIFLSKYRYLFKAIFLNLKNKGFTPSTDDKHKFPSYCVKTSKHTKWKKDESSQIRLSKKLTQNLKQTDTKSFIVIRNQKIICERYWDKHNATTLQNSFSMAKGVLSLLVGCAIDDGFIKSEEQLVSSLLPHLSEQKHGKHLTLKHLMTMQAALDWNEEYRHPFAENSRQYFVSDLNEQMMEVTVKGMPGLEYEYQSASAQILGMALKKAVGKSLSAYLSEKIWIPLEMENDAHWGTDENGMEKAFCCVYATPRDFARLGQLILQKGLWKGKKIISQNYIENMLLPTKANDAFCYSIWANDQEQHSIRFLYGFLGQFIIIVPSKNIIIVKNGFCNNLEVDEKLRPLQVQFIMNEILKTID